MENLEHTLVDQSSLNFQNIIEPQFQNRKQKQIKSKQKKKRFKTRKSFEESKINEEKSSKVKGSKNKLDQTMEIE